MNEVIGNLETFEEMLAKKLKKVRIVYQLSIVPLIESFIVLFFFLVDNHENNILRLIYIIFSIVGIIPYFYDFGYRKILKKRKLSDSISYLFYLLIGINVIFFSSIGLDLIIIFVSTLSVVALEIGSLLLGGQMAMSTKKKLENYNKVPNY